METLKFVIYETPFACWDWNLREKNIEFLEGIDADYFSYVANLNLGHVNDEDRHRAAVSLRLAYSHGLETLFSLLCSAVQAPQCAIGFILNYRNTDLLNLVKKISNKEPVYTKFRQTPVSWGSLAEHIHSGLAYEEEKKVWIQRGFGKLWSWFANEFADENMTLEYNCIKHGLRARPGGFDLAVGREDTPGIPAPSENMVSLGGSAFGSSYFVKEFVATRDKLNFRPRRHARNWSIHNLANGLILISMSINNVVSWLRSVNGVPMNKCRFMNPVSEDRFEEPWKESVGVNHASMDLVITAEHVIPSSAEDILQSYQVTQSGAFGHGVIKKREPSGSPDGGKKRPLPVSHMF